MKYDTQNRLYSMKHWLQTKGATYQNSFFVCMNMSFSSICLNSEDLRRQTERRSHLDLGEFWRSLQEIGRGRHIVWGLSCEPSRRPCPCKGRVPDHDTPQGQDRQTEPHRVNVMVTAAGTVASSPRSAPSLKKCQTFRCGGSGFLEVAGLVVWC